LKTKDTFDVIIIGAGHNGLVCACYLAQTVLKVCLLEKRHIVGGAAVTEEFYPGFRNSTASYTVSLLHPKVIADLRLKEHGLSIIERPISNFLPLADNNYIKIGGGLAATQMEVARFSQRDASKLPEYYAMLESTADVLRDMLLETPPSFNGSWADWTKSLKLANQMKNLSLTQQRDLLDFFTKSAGDL
jgi:phytoene dehydrogenase-like protein